MLSNFNVLYVLGVISLIGAGLFPMGYLRSFNIFLFLFILGLTFILGGQFFKRKNK